MSDKFIKFGPAWLRDFGRDGTGRDGTTSNFQNQGNNGSNSSSNTSVTNANGPNINTSSTQQTLKVQLAKMRYGREEMLAMFDQENEPPGELRHLEHLFNPRGKPPLALLNTFDDDPRDVARGAPATGGNAQNERFGLGRGYLVFNENRGKARLPFIQRTVTTGNPGRGQYMKQHGPPSLLGFPERSAEEPPFDVSHRTNWANNNQPTTINLRNSAEAEWNNNNPNKMYKSRWQGNNTNWRRQPNERRGDEEEWRLPEAAGGGARPRSTQQQDKWVEWGDKGERGRERPQPWHNNRRTWAADSPGAEENLPEWAVDSAEACGGTFDSSGAFHGYSNDDSNIPKTTSENTYALSRSHTQGSFSRSKPIDENSDEWWASEKAKVLSPKRFDAVEPKFKKSTNNRGEETSASRSLNTGETQQNMELKFEELRIDPNEPERDTRPNHKKNVHFKQNLMESKTFDALMRSDINVEEASDERGNFKSVMITPNNSLRQRHQNLVPTAMDMTTNQNVTAQNSHPIGMPTQNIGDRYMGSKQSSPSEEEIAKYIKSSRPEPETSMENPSLANSYKTPAAKAASIRKPAESMGGPLPLSSDINTSNMSYNRMHTQMSIPAPGSIMSTGIRLSVGTTAPKPTTSTGRNDINDLLNMPLHPGETQGMPGNIPMPTSQHMAHMPMPNLQNSGRGGLNELLNIPLPRETCSLNAAGIPMPNSHSVGMPIQNLQHGVGLSGRIMNSAGLMCQVTSSLPTTGICTTRVQSQANSTLPATNMSSAGMSTSAMIGATRPSTSISGYSAATAGLPSVTSSLFLGQNTNTIPVNVGGQSNMFMQGLQQQPNPSSFGSSMYSGITPNPAEQWYYEDPEKNIQGPFSSSSMYNWYRSGFFTSHLMVRRACDSTMRPLGSYGPVPPFDNQMYGGLETRPYTPHDNMRNAQSGLSDVIHNMPNIPDGNLNAMGYGNNYMMAPNYSSQPMVDSLWGQPSPSADMMWMQPNLNPRNETSVNSLPMFMWNRESSSHSTLRPESITKEMKTEDEILAQLRASQNLTTNQNIGFHNDPVNQQKVASNLMAEETALSDGLDLDNLTKLMNRETKEVSRNMKQNLQDLDKIIQTDTFDVPTPAHQKSTAVETQQASLEALEGLSISSEGSNYSSSANKAPEKQMKTDPSTKSNKKKLKKDQSEVSKDQEVEERTEGLPVTKSKKEKKPTKKDIEKEKKEWVKEGFTIVKSPEKSKDSKKKECKLADEAERKRKEDEKLAEEEEKKRPADSSKKQQVQPNNPQRPSMESVMRKAPWSAVSAGVSSVTLKDAMTLAEIQRLERDKKLEQMKEQQQMMQLIAQQQQAALAREQEMQAGLGWSKRPVSYPNRGPSLNDIQRAETRKQQASVMAAAAAAVNAASQVLEPSREAATSHHVWGSCPTEAGFWDTDRIKIARAPVKPIEKPGEPAKPVKPVEVPKAKKKQAAPPVAAKKDKTPQTEFENWCETVLVLWSSKIDVPTFIGFLKDIESPYEVKDYVKCYLGDTKDSCDFARQFLEKRSKLLRSSTKSPVDDLCSPAVAINPRSASNAEYQEVKGKGKKSKKKMFKVDARILGFSVTASEDRINVGDIDTA